MTRPQLDRTIWRYMSLSKFLWLLQNKKLWFSRADLLSDPWELALAGEQLDHVILRPPIIPDDPDNPIEPRWHRVQRFNENWRLTTYINCWSTNDHESYALWRVFCGTNEGVAISTTWYALGKAIGNVKLYAVDYGQPGDIIDEPTAIQLATRKRVMFDYEREVRAIATHDTNDPSLIKGEFGFEYPIDPEQLVSSISVHPEADKTFFEAVARAVSDYAPKLASKVDWSVMKELPPLLQESWARRWNK